MLNEISQNCIVHIEVYINANVTQLNIMQLYFIQHYKYTPRN